MQYEQKGTRIKALEGIVGAITEVYELASPDGIRAVKFFNAKNGLQNVRYKDWKNHFNAIKYDGISRIGAALKAKVLDQFVWKNPMMKPLLVMIITDGDVSYQPAPRIYSWT